MKFTTPSLLSNVNSRVAGHRLDRDLKHMEPRRLFVEMGEIPLATAVWVLPVLDTLLRRFRSSNVSLRARPEVEPIFREHVRQQRRGRGRPVWVRGSRAAGTLTVRLSRKTGAPRLTTEGNHATLVLRRPSHCPSDLHQTGRWVDACYAGGLHPSNAAPRLRLSFRVRREARATARELTREHHGPLVALMPGGELPRYWGTPAHEELIRLLSSRIGGTFVQLGGLAMEGATVLPSTLSPAVRAALLGTCSVAIGDNVGEAHLCAAVGTPVVIMHGHTDPTSRGPCASNGASCWSPARGCALCADLDPGPERCLGCLPASHVARVAERLAATRWPWDRLKRWIP